MSEKIIKIGLVVLCWLLIAVIVLFVIVINAKPLDKDGMINHRAHELIGISYEESDKNSGELINIQLMMDNQNQLIMHTKIRKDFESPSEIQDIVLDSQKFELIKDYCIATNILLSGEFQRKTDIDKENPVIQITFYLENESIIISSLDELTSDIQSVFDDVKKSLLNMIP